MQRTLFLSKEYLASYSGFSKECWQSVFLTFVESLATGICFFLSLYFINILHITMLSVGFLTSSYSIGTICGGYLSGKLSDQYSAKKISTLSLLAQSIAFLFLSKLDNEIILLINMFLIGFCAYSFITTNNIWMLTQCQNFTNLRLKSINITRAASNLGMGISGIIIGLLKEEQFQSLFYLSSLILGLSAIYFHYFVNDKCKLVKHMNNTDEIDLKISQQKSNKKIIILMMNCIFLIGLIIAQLNVTYPVYIQQSFPQLGTSAVSILFTLDTLIIVIFQLPLINILKDYNTILLVGVGALLMGLGMLLLNFSLLFYMAVISCIVWTTGEMIFISMSQFVCYESGAENNKGQTMGAFQATSAAGKLIGPIMGGYIYYQVGAYYLWYLCMIIGGYCFIMCLYFKKYKHIMN